MQADSFVSFWFMLTAFIIVFGISLTIYISTGYFLFDKYNDESGNHDATVLFWFYYISWIISMVLGIICQSEKCLISSGVSLCMSFVFYYFKNQDYFSSNDVNYCFIHIMNMTQETINNGIINDCVFLCNHQNSINLVKMCLQIGKL